MKRCFRITTLIALSLVVNLLALVPAKAQELSAVEQLRELNRAGKWDQAAEMAVNFLDSGAAKSNKEKCQIYTSLLYSQTRLGRTAQSGSAQAAYEKLCSDGVLKMSAPKQVNDNFWKTSAPATVGVNAEFLEKHQQLCERTGADACLVIRQGRIVQELYSERYRAPIGAMSSTKSIAGLLTGMLIDDGKIKSLDEPVCNYISQWCTGEKSKVTLRHLLAMTSGLPHKTSDGVGNVSDKNPYVIEHPLAFEPGEKWNYSNEGVQLLSPILDKAAGEPIQEYARKRLFEPLGMRETRLHLDSAGHAWTYADMQTTPRDFARIGLLMLGKGMWQNRRIISEAWIEQSTRSSQNLNDRYGLLWWLYEKPKGYGAQGYLNTNLYVIPEADLIVVRMQSKPLNQESPYTPEALKLFNQMVQK